MKHIKLLFSISLIALSFSLSAQNIVDSARFLQFTFNNVGRSQVSAYLITRTSGSGRDFTYSVPGAEIIEKGDSIYINDNQFVKNVLYYNYALNEQDTFLFTFDGRTEKMVVDSIRMHPLTDGLLYKHWYLKTETMGIKIWIKGLGEKTTGWVPYNMESPGGFSVKAICKHNEMIYWDSTFTTLEPYTIIPTCNFEQFQNYHHLPAVKTSTYTVFPNPTNNELFINFSNENQSGILTITTVTGKQVIRKLFHTNAENTIKINTTDLQKGIYFLHIEDCKGTVSMCKWVKGD